METTIGIRWIRYAVLFQNNILPKKERLVSKYGVNIYVKKSKRFYANTSLLGKIHIEESALKKLSDNALKTMVMHERLHQIQHSSTLGIIVTIINFFVLFVCALGITISVYLLFRPNYIDGIVLIIFFISVIFLDLCLLRMEEVAADLYSAKEIGPENFISGLQERYVVYPKYGKYDTLCSKTLNCVYLFTHGTKEDRINIVKNLVEMEKC